MGKCLRAHGSYLAGKLFAEHLTTIVFSGFGSKMAKPNRVSVCIETERSLFQQLACGKLNPLPGALSAAGLGGLFGRNDRHNKREKENAGYSMEKGFFVKR